MIDERLVGTWWAMKKNGRSYSIFKGPSACSIAGDLPNNAISCWYSPFNVELQKLLWGENIILIFKNGIKQPLDSEHASTENITFPPEDYIEDNSITEIEIKPNGDYMIFDSIPI